MREDAWYKEFGAEHVLNFYHILHIEQTQHVKARLYKYDNTRKRIITQQEKDFNAKWWMEQELHNNIHEIPSNSVPFLISF